jgi:NodT family efflux transporter outer membrane factor (OMF) lipoprotein
MSCVGAGRRRVAAAATLALLAAGCAVGPDYRRPSAPITPTFKEAAGWRPADPADGLDKGAWWSMFGDPELDALERRVATSNQTVKQYEAAYRESHAIVAEARAAFFPTVTGALTAQRAHTGSVQTVGSTAGGVATTGSGGGSGQASTTATVALLEASWVPDLWGRVRRNVESETSLAQASAAQLANARLAAQAALAQDYFELRVLDEEASLYRDTVAGYEQFLKLTNFQFQEGTQPLSAVVSARTQLLGAQATLISVGAARAQMEHAIAVLTGAPPAAFSLAPATLGRRVPVAPAGVPSTLLQRRPDIAAAERQVSAANAQVGVAVAAYFPDLTLSAQRGAPAGSVANLFSASKSLWSVGATLSETVLDFGVRRAQVRAARAVYDEDVAAYRQTVLTAFQGVEDELAALRVLEQQQDVVLQAEAAATETVRLDLAEYREGVVDYTTVITAQAAAFAASQNVLSVLLDRYRASVLLVEDLGGGWSTADLPKE